LSNPANRQTNRHKWKHNLLCGGNYVMMRISVFSSSSCPVTGYQ